MRRSGKCMTHLFFAALAAGTLGATSDRMPEDAIAEQSDRSQARAGLERFLESYFATWSSGDMGSYKAHFYQHALIVSVENGRIRLALPRDSFVELQTKLIANAEAPMVERMTSYTADVDETAATVVASWLLEKGDEKKTGIDRFTLIRDDSGNWKIVALLFYLDR